MKFNLSNDYTTGFITGIVKTLSGHPFDTLKVFKQSNNKISFNLKTLYRGVSFPLLSSSLINSVAFGTYNHFYKITNDHFCSGLIAGTNVFLISAPLDTLKVRKQINNYKIKFTRNSNLMLLRESLGYGINFKIYSIMRENFSFNPFISGGITSLLSWSIIYPIDNLKTKYQSQNKKLFQIIKDTKLKNFYSGFQYCIIRAIITGSVGFYTFEKIKNKNIHIFI